MDDREMDPYRESVEAEAALLHALAGAGTTPERARALVARLVGAVHDLAMAEAADAATADLEALAPRLGMDPEALVWLADHARWTGPDRYEDHAPPAVVAAN